MTGRPPPEIERHSARERLSSDSLVTKSGFVAYLAKKRAWSEANGGLLGVLRQGPPGRLDQSAVASLKSAGHPFFEVFDEADCDLRRVARMPRDLDEADLDARPLLSGSDPASGSPFLWLAGRNEIERIEYAAGGLPFKAWKLGGAYTVARSCLCMNDGAILASPFFHPFMKVEDFFDLLAVDDDSAVVLDQSPDDQLPDRSFVLPNSLNFGHVILGFFPTLSTVAERCSESIGSLVIRKSFPREGIFRDIWERVVRTMDDTPVIVHPPQARPVRVSAPVLSTMSYAHSGTQVRVDPDAIRTFRRVLGVDPGPGGRTRPQRIIYLARRDRYRRVRNEDQVIDIVERRGGSVVHINDLGLPERIDLLSSARIVIGVAGGTLANGAFCPPHRCLIELRPEEYDRYFPVTHAGHEAPYIAAGLGHDLVRVPCSIHEADSGSPILWDLSVPVRELQTAIDLAMALSARAA